MGKRADVILLISGIVFVIEFKVGAKTLAQRHQYFHCFFHCRAFLAS